MNVKGGKSGYFSRQFAEAVGKKAGHQAVALSFALNTGFLSGETFGSVT